MTATVRDATLQVLRDAGMRRLFANPGSTEVPFLADRPDDVVLVEETPSTRPDLHRLLAAKRPRGFVSAAMGGLGFGLPAAAARRVTTWGELVGVLDEVVPGLAARTEPLLLDVAVRVEEHFEP